MTNSTRLLIRCQRIFAKRCLLMLIFYLVEMVKIEADSDKFIFIEVFQLLTNNIEFT